MTWEDRDDEVTVPIRVPAHTKARDVAVVFDGRTALRVEVGTLAEGNRVVVDGELFQPISSKDDCGWSLEDLKDGGRNLVVEIEKAKTMRWLVLTRSDSQGPESQTIKGGPRTSPGR